MKINKPKIVNKLKNVTLDVLENIFYVAEGLAGLSLSKKAAYDLLSGYSQNEWSQSQISKLFYRLKQSGYIEAKVVMGQESIVLTNKTKIKLIDRISDNIESDGKFRFISFDIPEDLRRNRNQFRRAIKKLGFRQVQKSLWVCDKNVGKLVQAVSYEYGVEKYTAYIVSEKSDIDGIINKLFVNK